MEHALIVVTKPLHWLEAAGSAQDEELLGEDASHLYILGANEPSVDVVVQLEMQELAFRQVFTADVDLDETAVGQHERFVRVPFLDRP